MNIKIIFLIPVVALMFSCNSGKKVIPEEEKPLMEFSSEQTEAMGIVTQKPVVKDFSETIYVRGKIILPVEDRPIVSSSISGKIDRLFVSSGDVVQQNDPLLQLSGMEIISLQENYLISQVQLQKLEKDLDRKRLLVGENVVSDKDFEFVKAEYERILIQNKALQLKLELVNINPDRVTMENMVSTVTIYSPENGIVNDIFVSTGAGIEAEQDLMLIAITDAPLLELYVPETEFSLIAPGQRVDWDIINTKGHRMTAKVMRVSASINQASRSFLVIARPDDYTEKLLPGMFISARIQSGEDKGIAVPESAVFYNENRKPYLFIQKEDRTGFNVHYFMPGKETDGYIEVLKSDSLFLQQQVVVEGGYYLKSVLLMEE